VAKVIGTDPRRQSLVIGFGGLDTLLNGLIGAG
jgi:hypothetical protein